MNIVWRITKAIARATWFRQGAIRRCFAGPYSGLRFELCPQLLKDRMCVFYQAYEPDVTSFLSRVVQSGHVVVVVGAHVGIHVLYISKLLKRRGAIYAFEAWPDNYHFLERNIDHNASRMVTAKALNMAVCNREGMATITKGGSDGTHHLTRTGEAATCQVKCTTLDDFTSQTACRPDLILVDVEGAEIEVLEGAERLLAHSRPALLIEHHGPILRNNIDRRLCDAGYEVHPVGGRHVYATSHNVSHLSDA